MSEQAPSQQTAREQAEQELRDSPREVPATIQDPALLLHELQVHQIELEHQNEELRRALQETEEAHRKYQELFDFAPIGYLTVDRMGLVQAVNEAASSMLGMQRSRLTGRQFGAYIAAEYRGHFTALMKRIFESLDKRVTEVLLLRSDGTTFWAQLEGAAISKEGKPGDSCRVAVIDIHVQKQVQQEIMHLNQTLEQRVEERSAKVRELSEELERFTYDVAVDLQGPLRHIETFVDRLGRHQEYDEEALRYIEHIRSSGERMTILTTALLSFSRASRMRMRSAPLPMDQVFKDVQRKLRPQLKDRNVRLTSDPLPVVQGDSGAMQLVLRELLDNALKFTRDQPDPRIHVYAQDLPREHVLAVSDNGVGFNMRYRDRLFNVFQRLHNERDFEGAGVGLVTVRRVVSRQGGRVWAEGHVGEGATFYVALPKQPDELD
ncbi:ATP-binding protein [Deinococcus deserti]|uniref:histidine kinase n=1 Tax=Deinococcus deserti (strain DSM 17065 / CIP 109153 / LMG 22923 / VCD115) TaxID=546414 RepID=C1CZ45_DEIDV|nr:ATP-binding protein [Deinococcus deserti]ACO45083.1 putative histidine kinase, classic [Deinococcus deserti VCD115]